MTTITYIGAGVMASGLTFPAFENGHTIRMVGTPLDRAIIDQLQKDNYHMRLKRVLHTGITYYQVEDLDVALEGADVVVCGVSSFGVDWFTEKVLPKIPPKVRILSVTKGLLDQPNGALLTFPAYWQQKAPDLSIYAIGGPCVTRELADHEPSCVTYCGKNKKDLVWLRSLFETSYYHISLSTDVAGVETAVALKNGYALGVALTIGLQGGKDTGNYNAQAAAFGQAVREMERLIVVAGGQLESSMVGIGDLYVTVFGGRSRKIGILLGEGYSLEQAMEKLQGETLESVVIASRVASAIKTLHKEAEFPLLIHMDGVINEGKPATMPWKEFETTF